MQSDKSKALIDSITDSIKNLAAMTDATAKSEMFKTWLLTMSRFHNYSFNNQLLIFMQRRNATRVAGFQTWKQIGRNVKKGAKGIAILAPCISKKAVTDEATGEETTARLLRGFRVTHVFDYADTEGKEIPDLTYRATEGGDAILPRLEAAARNLGIELEYKADTNDANGYSQGGKIVVNSALTNTEKCGTIAHELAHEILHWRNNRRDGITREQRELEAESTSYAVLAQLGIEQPSGTYLASWDATAEAITAALQTIRNAVHEILQAMDDATEAEAEQLAA